MFKYGDIIAQTPTKQLAVGEYNKFKSEFYNLIGSRNLIFSLCSNTLGSLAGYLASIETKNVSVMLDSTMHNDMLNRLLDVYNPNYLWIPKDLELCGEVVLEFENYILLKNNNIKIEIYDDLALLLTTSGSTGSPKFVRLSYKNLESNAQSIAQYLSITADERPITVLPMHYSYGLSVINSHLISGATILLTDKSIVEKDFWTFFTDYSATSIAGVPYTYQMIKQFRMLRRDMPSLKTLTQAGGKLSPELVTEFTNWAEQSGRKFFVMYGQTEATARMSYLPPDKTLDKCASIGIAIPGGEFSIIDTDGNEINDVDCMGELVYKGDNVSLGYAETSQDLLKGDVNNGILHTGDIAQFDNDNYFYIVGRLKRFVKIFGNRINLDHVEQLAKDLSLDCACTGVDDKLTIHIVDYSLSDEMRKFISCKTGLHISAIDIKVVNEIPKNSSGKVQYSQL